MSTLLVRDIIQHAHARKLEWLMAGMMIHLGWTLQQTSVVFAGPAFTELAKYASENTWAVIFGAFGIVRLVVLVLNGTHLKQSAELRIVLSAISFLMLFTWIWGLNASGNTSLGGLSYKWLAIGELANVWQASSDRLARRAAKNGLH